MSSGRPRRRSCPAGGRTATGRTHRRIALCRASDRTRLGLDQERPRLVGRDDHPVEVGIRRRHTEDRLLLHRENGPALRVELPESVPAALMIVPSLITAMLPKAIH